MVLETVLVLSRLLLVPVPLPSLLVPVMVLAGHRRPGLWLELVPAELRVVSFSPIYLLSIQDITSGPLLCLAHIKTTSLCLN